MATKTIKPGGGGDFTTLALWEDYADGQASASQWAKCYSGGNLGAVTLAGWSSTPSASLYPRIYAASGNQHGASSSAGAYISASAPMSIGVDYTRIDGIRVSGTTSSNPAITFLPSGTSRDCKVENCFVRVVVESEMEEEAQKKTTLLFWMEKLPVPQQASMYMALTPLAELRIHMFTIMLYMSIIQGL